MADDKQNEDGRSREESGRRDQSGRDAISHRLRRMRNESLKPPISQQQHGAGPIADFSLDCGWGRLIFGQTYQTAGPLIRTFQDELPDRRDIAIYVRDPHVLLANAPQDLFLDPSHTYRLTLATYRSSRKPPAGFFIRRLTSRDDAEAMNRIYAARGMVPVEPDFFWNKRDARSITYFVAEDDRTGQILGTVTGVDHARAFTDPELGASLWCLAVDPQVRQPGVGEALVRRLAEYFAARGSAYLDLSVLHDNSLAITLYEKLGFRRVPFFTIKRKNPINEVLFTGPDVVGGLNPYAAIIAKEARRRGIDVKVMDTERGFFRLSYGGRSIRCRESLTDLTSALAMSICDDKIVTHRVAAAAGVRVPEQLTAESNAVRIQEFVDRHGAVAVKPVRGEQGRGVSVGLTELDQIEIAIDAARSISNEVVIEEQVEGDDLRLVVINYRVVAAAVRMPPQVTGDGKRDLRSLIDSQSRRRAAATGGESTIPIDEEARRAIGSYGYDLDTVLPEGERVRVRRTANLHTGGTIHDVTDTVHPSLIATAIKVARAIEIPVVGVDLMVPTPRGPDYAFIEANERPGLANHEPQPTAERFIDLLFPLTLPAASRQARYEPEPQEMGHAG